MKNKLRVLVVSGPTREPLDPVRYLSNYSTGTMGSYLAQAVRERKHLLTWVRCPEYVETARELEKKLKSLIARQDVLIMAAAVCDVRPKKVSAAKIKKKSLLKVDFIKNPDILASLGRQKKKGQIFVGFGLESENILKNGVQKMKKKNLDLIVVQKVTKKHKPFGETRLDAWILGRLGMAARLKRTTKKKIARILVKNAEILA